MNKRNISIIIIVFIVLISLIGFYLSTQNNSSSYSLTGEEVSALTFNMNKWQYDSENDIYYQIGVPYCTSPESTQYETLGIYVPGKYFDAVENPDGTYNCTVNTQNKVGNYSAENAPMVIPLNTPGYSAQTAPASYNSQEIKQYTDSGIVYVYPGCRGRDSANVSGGAPWGVVDIKAAVMFVKFNKDVLPGNTESIITFGHSGGGAQSAIVGASGDNELYDPYLESIGAAMVDRDGNTISNSVYGSMCWCPITNLDTADEAYEWYMGQYSTDGTRSNATWTSQLSNDLATSYANYINDLKLKDSAGNVLTLEESDSGIYDSGSYYDYQKSVIEESLNNFLADTAFPYSPSASGQMDGGAPGGDMPIGDAPSGDLQIGDAPSNDMSINDDLSDSQTYQTAKEYIDSLNSDEKWVEYDESSNTVKIKDIKSFVNHFKTPSKNVAAFDDLNRSQAENNVFGNEKNDALHFDQILTDLLKENNSTYSTFDDFNGQYISDYSNDLTQVDKMNNSVETRVNMYNPLYYLCDYYEGSGTSSPAKIWRINSGIEQGDTATTVETNLALALNQSSNVDDVELNVVWAQGHTQAERTGDSTSNFIDWINRHVN